MSSFELEANDTSDLWNCLNQMLSNEDFADFYQVRPYEGGNLSRKQTAVEESMIYAKNRAETLDLISYDWYCFAPVMKKILEVYYEIGEKSISIPSFIDTSFDVWWTASKPGGILYVMRNMNHELEIRKLLHSAPFMITKLQQFLTWYRDSRETLMAVNHQVAYATFIISPEKLMDAYIDFLLKINCLRMASFSLNSPSWWKFVTEARENFNLNLVPDRQQVNDAMAMMDAINRANKVARPVYLRRPREYYSWGFQTKFVWDLEHDPEFRTRMFKTDPELEAKFVELGGVSDELVDWLRSR